jgi:hypothetical protein
VDHRPPPDDRIVRAHEEGHAGQLHPVLLRRDDHPFPGGLGTLVGSDHSGDVGPVDVSIEQPDTGAPVSQAGRDVDRDGAFADAAFARRHHDHVFHPREDRVLRRTIPVDVGREVRLESGLRKD